MTNFDTIIKIVEEFKNSEKLEVIQYKEGKYNIKAVKSLDDKILIEITEGYDGS